MICMSDHADIGPVSITTDPEKFQQDLQELFVQVGTRMCSWIFIHVVLKTVLSLIRRRRCFCPLVDMSHEPKPSFFARGFSSFLSKAFLD